MALKMLTRGLQSVGIFFFIWEAKDTLYDSYLYRLEHYHRLSERYIYTLPHYLSVRQFCFINAVFSFQVMGSSGSSFGETFGESMGSSLGESFGEALGESLAESMAESLGSSLMESMFSGF